MTPIFTIQRKHDLYHIIDIAVDALTPDDPLNPAYIYLRGRPAAWLYLALAGHNYGAPPCTSSPMLARMARCDLASFKPARYYPHPLRERVEGYNLAAQVVREWGERITPGLGYRVVRRARG
jgi:hypothetical protein